MPNFSTRGGFGGEGYGIGTSLASYGADVERQGMLELGSAATQEAHRNVLNQQNAAMEKQGKIGLVSTLGSLGGMGLASGLASSSAAAAATAGGATVAGSAAAGAEAGAAAGPWGALIGGALGALAVGIFSR
jgi:hypothetical protein